MANGALFRLRVAGSEGLACTEYLDDDTVMVKEAAHSRPGMAGAALADRRGDARRALSSAHAAFWDGVSGSYLQAFAMVKWYDAAWAQEWREYAGAIWAWGSTKEAEKENTRP
ncbi:MAG: hypothetical protein ACLSAF_03745 [Intestinimonas sp.]